MPLDPDPWRYLDEAPPEDEPHADTYDEHQAQATLYQCTTCQRQWYRTKAGALDPTVCFECQNAEGR